MNNKPTPRTDAVMQDPLRDGNDLPELARQLENELSEALREWHEARELIDDIWITATSDHRFIIPPSKKQIPQHIEGIIKAYDKAHDDWTPEEIKTLMREWHEARKENKKLKEALLRVRTWGIFSKNFSATDSCQMAEWIDDGCAGELPKPDGPWIYEKMGGII